MTDLTDPDLDAVLDDAAFGFSRDGTRTAARTAPQPQSEHRAEQQAERKSQQEQRKSVPANRAFDPLAKKHQKHRTTPKAGGRRNEQRGHQTDPGDRSKDAGIAPSRDPVDTNTAMKSTLEALGMPGAHLAGSGGEVSEQSASSEDDESSALVDMIMRQLLSKDVLYEPMKEIGAKYPEYLAAEGAGLPEAELARYQAQQGYIRKICMVYESGEDKFDELMELLQGMQGCGNPPEAIMSEMGAGAGGLGGLEGLFGNGGGDDGGDDGDGAVNGCPVS